MDREILFRGQICKRGEKVRIDGTPVDGKWVYGGIFQGSGDRSIIYTYDPVDKFPVYAETVGQYTGLTDKKGVKIFEGILSRPTNMARTTGKVIILQAQTRLKLFLKTAVTACEISGGALTYVRTHGLRLLATSTTTPN